MKATTKSEVLLNVTCSIQETLPVLLSLVSLATSFCELGVLDQILTGKKKKSQHMRCMMQSL